jgi:hypothetical protein
LTASATASIVSWSHVLKPTAGPLVHEVQVHDVVDAADGREFPVQGFFDAVGPSASPKRELRDEVAKAFG